MDRYSIVAMARTPQESTSPLMEEVAPLNGTLAWTEVLNEAGHITVECGIETLTEDLKECLVDPLGSPLEIWVYKDADLIAQGMLIAYAIKNGRITLSARTLEYYTAFMVIEEDKDWADTDVTDIVVEIIDDWQDQDYGNYALNTATTSGSPTGNLRTQSVPGDSERPNVYDFIVDSAGSDNGFDWWIDSDRDIHVEAVRGTDLSDTVLPSVWRCLRRWWLLRFTV